MIHHSQPLLIHENADIDSSSDDYATRFAGSVGAWFLKVQEEATLAMLAPYRQARILDVGGGHGQLTQPLIQAGYEVTVLGSAEQCQWRIRSFIAQGQCRFDVGHLLALPYPDQAFDVVISYRLVAHVRHWQRFLRELARVARQAVLIDYAAIQSINYLTPYLFAWKKQVEGNTRTFTCFHESQLLKIFNQSGFKRSTRYPQYFFPMVLHRLLKKPKLSSQLEALSRQGGLTHHFGSPVILKVTR